VDLNPHDLVRKVWQHSGIKGNVWMPSISNIGKDSERFREGPLLPSSGAKLPQLDDAVDWYWTPAVSHGETRRIKKSAVASNYPAQRAVWVDCDESYDRKLLEALKPSFMWETSPGHTQAIWLLKDTMPVSEFHRDGFMGMLTQALGADKSGVDVSQLLRVPGTWHHKGKAFHGKVLRSQGTVFTRSMLLQRVARQLGFPAGLASELAADDPYGDRSKLLWKFNRQAAELGLPQDLTFKLIKATKWNKWADDPDRLKDDIAKAYEAQPTKPKEKDPERKQAQEQVEHDFDEDAPIEAWDMASVGDFGPVLRKPFRWVLPGIIPEAGCGLIVAAPKVGKTRIAIEIALGLATGKRPLGIQVPRPRGVGFLSLEDGEYLFAERLAAGLHTGREKYHWDGHIRTEDKGLVWEPPVGMELHTNFAQVDLSTPEDQQRLLETILKHELKLVIIDTLSMAIGKGNVSDQKEMYAVLKPVKDIAKATGCAVLFIHHTRKRVFEKGESIQESILGATALHAWSDFIMSLASPAEDEDFMRMGVQTKRASGQHYVDGDLRIIKRPVQEDA